MVKVDIICGMLGSGKTTLIKRMLETVYAGKRVIVIENEYGQVNLDAIELRKHQVEVKELTQGCVCCTMKLSFMEVFEQLGQRNDIDYIVIEPSGVADIAEFAGFCRTCRNVQLNRLIMVVNAKKIGKFLNIAGSLFINQIKTVNMVFLNFTDSATPEQIADARQRLLNINSRVQIIEKYIRTLTNQDFALISNAVRTGVQKIEDKRMYIMMKARGINEDNLHQQFVSWKNKASKAQMECLRNTMDDVLCEDIYRIKGFIHTEEGCIKVDYVTGDLFLEKTDLVEEGSFSQLVLIGRKHNVMWLHRQIMSIFCIP